MEYIEQYSLFSIAVMRPDFIRSATNKLQFNYSGIWTTSVYWNFMPVSFHYSIDNETVGDYEIVTPKSINIREASDCIPYY
jgi:hypothetical protein